MKPTADQIVKAWHAAAAEKKIFGGDSFAQVARVIQQRLPEATKGAIKRAIENHVAAERTPS